MIDSVDLMFSVASSSSRRGSIISSSGSTLALRRGSLLRSPFSSKPEMDEARPQAAVAAVAVLAALGADVGPETALLNAAREQAEMEAVNIAARAEGGSSERFQAAATERADVPSRSRARNDAEAKEEARFSKAEAAVRIQAWARGWLSRLRVSFPYSFICLAPVKMRAHHRLIASSSFWRKVCWLIVRERWSPWEARDRGVPAGTVAAPEWSRSSLWMPRCAILQTPSDSRFDQLYR